MPYVLYKVIKRTKVCTVTLAPLTLSKFIRPSEADLDSDQMDPADVVPEKTPTSAFGKFASKVFW